MDDLARSVGAGGGLTVTIAGKECTVRPLGIREMNEVERDCLQRYRRQYLETYSANLDLFPEGDRNRLMEAKTEQAARWDVGSLPPKFAHDPGRIKITEGLKDWLAKNVDVKDGTSDLQLRRLAAVALDQELLSDAQYEELCVSGKPPRMKVSYVNWWITGCFDGMITFIWTCFRHAGVTRDQVAEELGNNLGKMVEVSREIERLSAPQAGNG